jgi:hypothetical protein
MTYKFEYQTTANDFFRLSMYYVYGSIVGICNIIFTIAMILLTIKMWDNMNGVMRIMLLFASFLFPVLQPTVIYIRAKKRVAMLPKNMQISFDEKGIHIQNENQSSELKWSTIKRISKKPSMLIIFSTTTHGFILTNRVLGKQREEFYTYLLSNVKGK